MSKEIPQLFFRLFVRTKSYKGRALDSFWHRVSAEMVVINLIMCATGFKCQVGNVIPTLQVWRLGELRDPAES